MAKQQLNPAHKVCGAGDAAIAELVGANRALEAQDILFVCGDKNVPTRLRKAPSAAFVTVLPTGKFLDTAEQLGLISDANAAWKKYNRLEPTRHCASNGTHAVTNNSK